MADRDRGRRSAVRRILPDRKISRRACSRRTGRSGTGHAAACAQLITEPEEQAQIDRGEFAVRGVAWSGAAAIARVQVKLDDGPWQLARLLGDSKRHSWQWWELITKIDHPGNHIIRARASDMSGRVQPESPEWNRLGYCNNAIQEVKIAIH
jgi:hypothetical protein